MSLPDTVLALHPSFGIAPEVLDAITMATGLVVSLVVAVVHPIVFVVPDIHETVIAFPAIAIDLGIHGYDMLDYGL